MKISDAIKPLLETSPDSDEKNQLLIVNESFSKATDDCSITSINVETAQRDFIALQYALFVALFIQVPVIAILIASKLFIRKVYFTYIFVSGDWCFCVRNHVLGHHR